MEKRRFFIISLLWALIVPIGLVMTYQAYTPSHDLFSLDVLSFLVLGVLVSIFPIIVNKTPIFLLQSVTLAVFMLFGLFIEMLVTQVAILILLIKLTFGKEDAYRIPLNSLMFFLISLISGIVFYALYDSSVWGEYEGLGTFVSISGYVISYFVFNQLFIIAIRRILYKTKVEIFSKDFLWESVSSLMVFPIGVALYMLYNVIGEYALLVIGFPLISIAIMLRMYYSSLQINTYLKKAHDISLQMSKQLQVEQVVSIFKKQIMKLFAADYTYIFHVSESGNLSLYLKNVPDKDVNQLPLFRKIAQNALREKRSLSFQHRKEWMRVISDQVYDSSVESLLVIPIESSTKTTDILIIASKRKNEFEKYKQMILNILCSNFMIALENAKHYEATKRKSEYCRLTGVYNYGYFEELLKSTIEDYRNKELAHVALIILDLDFFKEVNDTHGHESGNEILCQVSERIQAVIGENGTVARYGGEEFVILFSNHLLEEVQHFAEQLRAEIANEPFVIHQDLQSSNEKRIHVTASIGVAEANREDEDALALVRYADRAMYNGAKRAGRNRVAVYE